MKTLKEIPYVKVAGQHVPIKEELLQAVAKIIDRGDFVLGKEVEEFESRFAKLCGTRFAVGLNSGTDALILALKALGIGPGDEVITAPNSFVASASCICLVGATPVFADVREDMNIDPAKIEQAITPRTKAILPVHLTGRPADMNPILEIAKKHNLLVVEDAAQAVIAEYHGKRVGSFGNAGCFSLHPLKTLNACGDGGMLVTNDESMYEKVKLLRNLGLQTRDNCVVWSSNSRLDTIQAAMLLVKLNYLESWTEKRRTNAQYYMRALQNIPQIKLPAEKQNERSVFHTFIIQTERRDELKKFLEERGIKTAIHYPKPIHFQSAAQKLGYAKGNFPVTESQAEKILSLPIYPELTPNDLETITNAIIEFYRS